MEWDKYLPSIISATSGLLGVVVGGFIAWLRETRQEKKKAEKESAYLAILVATHLDRFINGCLKVVRDDGSDGNESGLSPDPDAWFVTTPSPSFRPLDIDGNWKSLPLDLLNDILCLPYKQELIESYLAPLETSYAEPFDIYLWERQHRYAELGLDVSLLNNRIRQFAQLGIKELTEDSRYTLLQAKKKSLEQRKAEREERNAKFNAGALPIPSR